MSMIGRLFLAIFAGVLIERGAFADMIIPYDRETLNKSADVVALVRIVDVVEKKSGDTLCGAQYTGNVLRVSKGAYSDKMIRFGRHVGLEKGRSYRVYLKKVESLEDMKAFFTRSYGTNQFLSHVTDPYLICDGLVPGYIFMASERLRKPNGKSAHEAPKAKVTR
jgi:hypothetical protein